MTTYRTLIEAARGLLLDACSIANSSGNSYCVVGGWSSYLRNSSPVPHPGTHDVDLLFEAASTPGDLRDTIRRFLEVGFVASAKHEFQVLRVLDVNGQRFVFNVDFLHPYEKSNEAALFVDHLELPVPVLDFGEAKYRCKSIALPDANFVFNGFAPAIDVEGTHPTGEEMRVSIPLLDEVGVLVTKAKSFTNKKRTRDVFDAYLALTQPHDREQFQRQLRRLKCEDGDTYSALASWQAITQPDGLRLLDSAWHHFAQWFPDKKIVVDTFAKFLAENGFA